jgi:hypothetical protein
MQPGFRLVIRRGPTPNRVIELNRDVMTIGREVGADIVIADPEVSRNHCRFTRSGGGYMLEDLGSTNGTFVNGQRLTGTRTLNGGDMITLGETVELAYESPNMSAPPPPPPQQQAYGAAQRTQLGGMPGGAGQDYYAGQQGGPGGYDMGGQPGGAGYYDDEYYPVEGAGGAGRWLFLGCGVFIVLCIVTSVISIIIIDQSCAWDDVPVLSSIVDALGYSVDETACS